MIRRPSSRPFDVDLLRYSDGSLSDVEMALFEARLSSDPALRNDLRILAEQAFAIGEYARNAEAMSEIRTRSGTIALPGRSPSSWKTRLPWAAAAVLAISSLLFFLREAPPTAHQPVALLEVLEINGSASWISEDGARTVMLEKGMQLPAGALDLSSESGLARFRYDDDTTLSFTGVTDATITQASGKSLRIKRGQLTAFVSPQDADTPMQVETPTARVTIIGTRFTLDVEEAKTGLAVSEGMVRMRRLSDGQSQDVPAGHRLTSTLEPRAMFVPTALPDVADAWTSDFTRMPGITQGAWIPPDSAHPQGAVAAKAFIAGRQTGGGIITHYGVTWSSEPGFAILDPTTILRMKVRVERAAAIQLMLVTRMPDGTYTGNFEAKPIPVQPLAGGAWQEIEIPLARLQMSKLEYPEIPAGAMAHAFIITTYQDDAGLRIARLSLNSSR